MASTTLQHKHKNRPATSRIAKRANEIWEEKGKPSGQYVRSWHQAEAELRKLLLPHTDQVVISPTASSPPELAAGLVEAADKPDGEAGDATIRGTDTTND